MTIWEKIRLLQEWSPVVTYVQAFLATKDPHSQALIVADAADWFAQKTPGTTVDDELVDHITAILKSPQGESFLRWTVQKLGGDDK
jgi:hypothetical protein